MARFKEVLAFVNNKGGVAKTTTTHAVAAALLRKLRNSRVLVIDLDAQGNLSKLLRFELERKKWQELGETPTITDALTNAENTEMSAMVYAAPETPGLYFIPADTRLDNIGPQLDAMTQPNCALLNIFSQPFTYHKSVSDIQPKWADTNKMHKEERVEVGEPKYYIEDEFDYVLIDCPPGHGKLHMNAMSAATGVIIPVQLEMMSVGGVANIVESYRKVKRYINKDLTLRGLLRVMVDPRLLVAQSLTEALKEQYGDIVFKAMIHRCTDVSKAQCMPMSVVEYAPHSTAGSDYLDFAQELIDTYEDK